MHNLELFTFLIAGILIALIQIGAYKKLSSTGIRPAWLYNGLMLISSLFVFFGILWAVSSLAENETQAAMMGIVVFSGSGVVLGIVSYRLISIQLAKRIG